MPSRPDTRGWSNEAFAAYMRGRRHAPAPERAPENPQGMYFGILSARLSATATRYFRKDVSGAAVELRRLQALHSALSDMTERSLRQLHIRQVAAGVFVFDEKVRVEIGGVSATLDGGTTIRPPGGP